jgi:hypothetical protein
MRTTKRPIDEKLVLALKEVLNLPPYAFYHSLNIIEVRIEKDKATIVTKDSSSVSMDGTTYAEARYYDL